MVAILYPRHDITRVQLIDILTCNFILNATLTRSISSCFIEQNCELSHSFSQVLFCFIVVVVGKNETCLFGSCRDENQ